MTQRPPNITDAIAQAFSQIQQLNQSNLSGSQLYGLNPQTEEVFVDDVLTTVSSVGGQNYATLTINSVNQNGVSITGYTVNVYSKTGFGPIIQGTTPFTCTLLQGYDYIVAPLDFSPCNFNVWNDTGSSARFRRVSMGTSNQTLQANYVCSGTTTPGAVGVIVPLYVYPTGSSSWSSLKTLAGQYPSIPILLIVNPGSGPISLPKSQQPQTAADPVWTTALTNLASLTNISMIAYVDMANGNKALGSGNTIYNGTNTDTMQNEMNSYKSWYGQFLTGFFFDDCQDATSSPVVTPAYVQSASTAAKATISGAYTVGNPGTPLTSFNTKPATAYVGTMDNFVIWETDQTVTGPFSTNALSSTFITGQSGYAPSNWSYISYGYPSWTSSMATTLVNSMPLCQWLQWGSGSSPGQAGGSPYSVDGQSTSYLANMLATLAANGG